MNDNEAVIKMYERSIHITRSYGKSSIENNDNEDDKHDTKNHIIHNFDIDNTNKRVDAQCYNDRSQQHTIQQQQQKQHTIQHQPKISTKNTTSSSSSSMSLTWIQASCLITAECLGTGILALPASVQALSPNLYFGWIFLILQIPIHILAGILLCHTADRMDHNCSHDDDETNVDNHHHDVLEVDQEEKDEIKNIIHDKLTHTTSPTYETNRNSLSTYPNTPTTNTGINTSVTRDYVGLSIAIFGIWKTSLTTTIVMIVYYTNLFLVLGNYNLVMSHAMIAFLGGGCLPLAGILSSILGILLILLPLRSMVNFGRSVSLLSLMALLIVVFQCLVALSHKDPHDRSLSTITQGGIHSVGTTWFLTSRQLSAIASVAYAVGSQKLLLNVRNVMTVRQEASKSLIVAVSSYVMLYLMVCILAGSSTLLRSFIFYLWNANVLVLRLPCR
jgi:hypothetical protein